ncbi:hypothetical protein ACU686_08095 [Yinghuangia aomiensis]
MYDAHLPPTRITDAQVLASLPPAIPKATLALVGQLGTLTPQAKLQLAQLLQTMPDLVPRARTRWRAPTRSGIHPGVRHRDRHAARPAARGRDRRPGQRRVPPAAPGLGCHLPADAQVGERRANDGEGRPRRHQLRGHHPPRSSVGTVGALLIAAVLLIRRRRPRGTATPPPSTPPSTPTAPPTTPPTA